MSKQSQSNRRHVPHRIYNKKGKTKMLAKGFRTSVLATNAINYCETTSLHGFLYWVQARNPIEKLIWILITVTCFICSCFIVSLSIKQWIAEPGITAIQSYSKPVTEVNFPSVTLCNARGLDTGEYVRNVFNNLAFNSDSILLRDEFRMVLGDIVFDPDAEFYSASDIFSNFMDKWLSRCMKLDIFSNSLDAILKEHFTAFVMKEINSTTGFEDSKKSLVDRMKYNYGAMMLGLDEFEELYSYYPLWYENKTLVLYEANWMTSFTSPLEEESGREAWELILNCTQQQRPNTSGKSSKNSKNKKISKFEICFELHATEEVKVSVEEAGEYHKFILDKAFSKQKDEIVFESTCLDNETECRDHDHAWVLTSLFSYDSTDMYDFCTKHLAMKSQECGSKKFKIDSEVDKLQSWLLYSLILRESEWPSRDFGHLIDHFGAFTNSGMGNTSFKAIARSLFGIEDFELGEDLSVLLSNLSSECADDKAYVFPLPARLASLLMPTKTTFHQDKVHPDFIEGISTEQLLKMLQFGRWSKCRVRTGESETLGDVLRGELKIFEDAGFGIRDEFQEPQFPQLVLKTNVKEHMDSVKASLTDMGLCTTINANNIAGTFNIEKHEEIKAFADILDESTSMYYPIKVKGSGYIHQSIFWLNVRNPSTLGLQKGGITAAINNWNDYFSVRSQEIKIRAGRSYHLKIIPTLHQSTPEFEGLSKENRNCSLTSEVKGDSIFTTYSQKGCIFECTLKKINVNCTPWDYPFPRSFQDPYPLCTSYYDGIKHFNSLAKFNNAMEDPEITDKCSKECLPNCGEITYSYEMDTTDLEVDQLCHNSRDTRDMALSLWNATGNVQTWLHKLSLAKETYTATEAGLGFTWGDSDVFEKKFGILKEVAAKICATTFENDIAKLTLEIADPRMLEVVKDKRVTFADMLGTVGGTIGLFTGLSIISVFEFFYWIYKTVVQYVLECR